MKVSGGMKVLFGAVSVFVLAALAVAGLMIRQRTVARISHIDIDQEHYPVRGLDISAHNGTPDFDSIAAAGIDFVYLKASEGMTFRDPAFMRNYLAARRAGLAVGAYHFFRFDCDAAMQSSNFLAAIVGCDFQLPPVIDIEEWGNPTGYDSRNIARRLELMIDAVRARRGTVMLYTNKKGLARYLGTMGGDMPELWICSFTDPPVEQSWRLWQHSHSGKVSGVRGDVDLNTFNGSRDEWLLWLDNFRPAADSTADSTAE
ncbi:MAG: hypothetical protein K2M55_08060 [Muribaculaceae bacterium]|nr:hypothetical protein [Muribaculaceae bacterium]